MFEIGMEVKSLDGLSYKYSGHRREGNKLYFIVSSSTKQISYKEDVISEYIDLSLKVGDRVYCPLIRDNGIIIVSNSAPKSIYSTYKIQVQHRDGNELEYCMYNFIRKQIVLLDQEEFILIEGI